MKKTIKIIIIFLAIAFVYFVVGFSLVKFLVKSSNNSVNITTEKDVIKLFEKDLDEYDFKYDLDVFRFDKDSLMKKAFGNVTFNDKFKTTCSINGKLEKQYSGTTEKGTKYVVNDNCGQSFTNNIENYLLEKYGYIEVNFLTDYKNVAKVVQNYINEKKDLLEEYDMLEEMDFNKKYIYVVVPFLLNGNKINDAIYIDKRNNKVIYDTSAGEYGFIGVSELSEYLELLAQDKVNEKRDELHNENYGHNH